MKFLKVKMFSLDVKIASCGNSRDSRSLEINLFKNNKNILALCFLLYSPCSFGGVIQDVGNFCEKVGCDIGHGMRDMVDHLDEKKQERLRREEEERRTRPERERNAQSAQSRAKAESLINSTVLYKPNQVHADSPELWHLLPNGELKPVYKSSEGALMPNDHNSIVALIDPEMQTGVNEVYDQLFYKTKADEVTLVNMNKYGQTLSSQTHRLKGWVPVDHTKTAILWWDKKGNISVWKLDFDGEKISEKESRIPVEKGEIDFGETWIPIGYSDDGYGTILFQVEAKSQKIVNSPSQENLVPEEWGVSQYHGQLYLWGLDEQGELKENNVGTVVHRKRRISPPHAPINSGQSTTWDGRLKFGNQKIYWLTNDFKLVVQPLKIGDDGAIPKKQWSVSFDLAALKLPNETPDNRYSISRPVRPIRMFDSIDEFGLPFIQTDFNDEVVFFNGKKIFYNSLTDMTQGQPFKVLDYLKFEDESKRWGVINEGEKVKDKLGALKKDLNNKVESKARELEEQELRIKEERQNVERERQQVEREKQGNEDILNRLGKENADQKKVIEDLQRRLAANNAILEKILPPAAARPADLGNTNKNTQVKPSVTISSSPEVTNANLVSSKNKEGGSPRSAPGKLSADRFKSFQQELKK